MQTTSFPSVRRRRRRRRLSFVAVVVVVVVATPTDERRTTNDDDDDGHSGAATTMPQWLIDKEYCQLTHCNHIGLVEVFGEWRRRYCHSFGILPTSAL